MTESKELNVLCVLPDGSFKLFPIDEDYTFIFDSFWSSFNLNRDDFALYSITPSFIQILPYKSIKIQLNERFSNSVPDFRLQVLPVGKPHYIFRLYLRTDKNLKLAPWNIIFNLNSKFSLNNLNEIFNQTFCVDSEKREFEFYPDSSTIDLTAPISEQISALNSTQVFLTVTMQQKQADYARRRPKIIDEIIKTESNYVHELRNVSESFTKEFFQSLNMSVDIYGRTFKSIREIKPVHEQFFAALQPVGTAIESAIGHVFLEYYSVFKVASPHVCNFASANDEIKELLHTNKNFSKAVFKICKEKFDGKPIESVIVTPIQRLPRYPLLLKDLIKSTSENHWDYIDLKTSYNKIQELCQNMDNKKREQDELNFVAELQAKIGNQYNVLKTGRRGLASIENIKMRMKVHKSKSKREDSENESKNETEPKNEYMVINTKGSIYLFNDALLIWSPSANKFNEESLIPVKLVNKDGVVNIGDLCSISDSDLTSTFIPKFEEARRTMIMKQCSYGNAFAWTKMEYETGPPLLSSVSIVYYDDTLFLFGGRYPNGKCSNDLWIREEGRWRLVDTNHTPSPRYGCSMSAFDGKLVVFGGRNKNQFFNDLLIYEINTNTWSIIDCFEKPLGRIGHTSSLIKINYSQNKIVIRDGDSSNQAYQQLDQSGQSIEQQFQQMRSDQTDEEKLEQKMNDYLDSQLWVFGGQIDDDTYTNDLYVFDFATYQWFNFFDDVMPEPRSYSVSFWISDNMGSFKFGIQGGRNKNEAFNNLWFFDPQLNQWIKETPIGPAPLPCYGHVAANLNNSIYIFGGIGLNKEITSPHKLSLTKKQVELKNDSFKLECSKRQSCLDKCEESNYIWENIPQCDEPEYFIEGAVAVDSTYGFLLFGPTIGYSTIRLIFNDSNQLNCEHALSTEKKMKKITEMSSSVLYSKPYYNFHTQEVTMKIGSDEQCDFVLEFNKIGFDEFFKENRSSFRHINDLLNEKSPPRCKNRPLSNRRSQSSFLDAVEVHNQITPGTLFNENQDKRKQYFENPDIDKKETQEDILSYRDFLDSISEPMEVEASNNQELKNNDVKQNLSRKDIPIAQKNQQQAMLFRSVVDKPKKKYYGLNPVNSPNSQVTRSSTNLFINRKVKTPINSSREATDDSMIVFDPEPKGHSPFINDSYSSLTISSNQSSKHFQPFRHTSSNTIPEHKPPPISKTTDVVHHISAPSLGNLIDFSGIPEKK